MKLFKSIIYTVALVALGIQVTYSQNSKQLPQIEEVSIIQVKVKGVGCSKDVKNICAKVEELEGVSLCKVAKKGAVTRFEVYHLDSKVDDDIIYAAIEDTPCCKDPNNRPFKVKNQ